LAVDLVRHRVSVIFAGGGSNPFLAAKPAASTIPVVFASGVDPIDAGLVGSLNRPGGSITGITFLINTLAGKQLEVLYQLVPKATYCRTPQPTNSNGERMKNEELRLSSGTRIIIGAGHLVWPCSSCVCGQAPARGPSNCSSKRLSSAEPSLFFERHCLPKPISKVFQRSPLHY
jgi:putative ABC transport system substrate-binding protein